MLASFVSRFISPSKRSAPASTPDIANPASPSPSTRSPTSREASIESALTELSVHPEDVSPAPPAKKARLDSPAPASPSRALSQHDNAIEEDDEEPAVFAAKRTRTTRAGRADDDALDADDPALGTDGKPYLLCGLYWSAALPPREKRASSGSAPAPTDWRTVEPAKAKALPPPVYHGETLVEDEHAFRLPFDILRDFWYTPEAAIRTGKGKGKEKGRVVDAPPGPARREGKGGDKTTAEDIAKREASKKPDPYRYIGKNVYFGRGPDKALLPAICACKLPAKPSEMGCGEACINRLMQYCCDPKKCPCGPDRCSNLPLNKRPGIPEGKDGLRVIWTGNRGFGLKTMVDIREGQFVIEYRGEIISRDESYRRVLTTYKDQASYYFMDYDGFEVVDAGQRGNAARFINHSCGPNLQVVRWRLATMEEYQMGLFALHDIPAGTELTYDYGWQDFSSLAAPTFAAPSTTEGGTIALSTATAIDPARQRCYCGAAACSGFLGGRRRAESKKGKGVGAAEKGKGKGVKRARVEEHAPGSGNVVEFAQARVVLHSVTILREEGALGEGSGSGLKRSGSGRKAAREAMGKMKR